MELRTDFIQSLVDLPRQEGSSLIVDDVFAAPSEMGNEMMGVKEGSPMDVHLTLTSVSEGVYISGSVETELQGECSRCLKELSREVSEDIAELVFYPERFEAHLEDGDEKVKEFFVIKNDEIDLEPIIRDNIVLNIPFMPLCTPDCQGLCSGCGKRWEDLPEDHNHELAPINSPALDQMEALLKGQEGKAQ